MAASHLIQLEHVRKTYVMGDVEVHALRGVSLHIDRGEFTAVMGASGSGKSTLMNIVGLLDRPTSGQYLLDGEEVSRLTVERLAEVRNRTIGFVFQSFNLLARTSALENVELPLLYAGTPGAERRARAAESLTRVGLADRLDHHPNQMSGGQQQRVAIARALIHNPSLVLADEPTASLDTERAYQVVETFAGLIHEQKRAGIMVTHDLRMCEYVDRVLQMRDGKLVQVYSSRDEIMKLARGGREQ